MIKRYQKLLKGGRLSEWMRHRGMGKALKVLMGGIAWERQAPDGWDSVGEADSSAFKGFSVVANLRPSTAAETAGTESTCGS